MGYYGKEGVIQIGYILNCTKGYRRPDFTSEKLNLINVTNAEVQKDWEITRDILSDNLKPQEFYDNELERVNTEKIGSVKISINSTFEFFFQQKFLFFYQNFNTL